jgi:hypothetical protein
MYEHHLAHNKCLLKNKCLPYGNDSCQKNEETLPTACSYLRVPGHTSRDREVNVLVYFNIKQRLNTNK